MSRRLWFGVLVLLVCRLGVGARVAVAQPAYEAFSDLDETFSIDTMHRPFIHEAPAVVRLDAHRFVVEGPGAATEHVHRAVTILNPEGKEHARLVLPYDKFRHIDRLEGRIRDVRGNVVRTLGKDDQRDFSAISTYSLYEERRVRVAELFESNYPYTVEFEYVIERDGLISWPTWRAHERSLPVERTLFEVDAPDRIPLRYVVKNGTWAPERGRADGRHWMRWTEEYLSRHEGEPYGPPWRDQVPTVHTAPTAFEIEDVPGRMDDWAAFAQWYHRLGQGRTRLPAATAEKVRAMAAAARDTPDLVERLYRFMQDRTRYVSVQLGIGGWQPFPASYVEERGYGDCKALTNYMQALLGEAGIESFPVLIRAGGEAPRVLPDFPSNQFNHVLLAVPLDGDTLWLENTDQTAPFGHLGADTEDRHGLLVTAEGGRLVRTPRSSASDNAQRRRARVRLALDGRTEVRMQTVFTGNQQDRVRRALAKKTRREREEWLRETIDLPGLSVEAADFAAADRRDRVLTLPIELTLSRYGSRTGQRIFFRPNLMQHGTRVPPASGEGRATPVRFGPYPYVDTDTITYVLPDGYAVEAAPAPARIERPFGHYEAYVEEREEGTLRYVRRMEVRRITLQPDEYDPLRTFLRQVARADRQQVVLVRQEQ